MAADSAGASGVGVLLPHARHVSLLARRGRHCRKNTWPVPVEPDVVQTILTCNGNLSDPDFPIQLSSLLDDLSNLLNTGNEPELRVTKLEPWNSVRVTLTIPREAAQRLRALAQAGDAALQALGILSVQLDGDQVISLRLTARFGGEPQEIVLRAADDSATPTSNELDHSMGSILSAGVLAPQPCGSASSPAATIAAPGSSGSGAFRSPNVVAPGGAGIPPSPSPRPHVGPSPYPFTSMTHAAQAQHSRDTSHHSFAAPPPYPTKSSSATGLKTALASPSPRSSLHQSTVKKSTAGKGADGNAVSLSSPLLVNLLQNDGAEEETGKSMNGKRGPPPARQRPAPPRTSAVQPGPQPPPPPPPPRMAKPFQQSATTTCVPSPRSSLVPPATPPPHRFPLAQVRPVIQGYSQFTAASSKPSPSSSAPVTDSKGILDGATDSKKLIINPLTGELEPMPSESEESEEEPGREDPFVYTSSMSRSFSDDDSTISRRNDTSDLSDSEATKSASDASLGARRRVVPAPPGSSSAATAKGQEKIKLRLKLEKTEAYKVDLSFVNCPQAGGTTSSAAGATVAATVTTSPVAVSPVTSVSTLLKKPVPVPGGARGPGVASVPSAVVLPGPGTPGPGSNTTEEPRVPPLHISLRGRNAAVVVGNRKEKKHWSPEDVIDPFELDPVDPYTKLTKKKLKPGRDLSAIHNSQKPKKLKLKRMFDMDNVYKLKVPVVSDEEDKIAKKKKDSKKKNSIVNANKRHMEEEGNSLANLKMDSEEWISRTLKEETLNYEKRKSYSKLVDGGECTGEQAESEETQEETVSQEERTKVFELSDLLRRNSAVIENNKKVKGLECLKVVKLVESDVDEEAVREDLEGVAKKPKQEIGGKIKSELSSKIDRVSGKLKNDLSVKLSKESGGKKLKFEDSNLKKSLDKAGKSVVKGGKVSKKEGLGLRVGLLGVGVSSDGEGEELQLQQVQVYGRAKRRHSGDHSLSESQTAQKVKSRSSSSDQVAPKSSASRRFDVVSRKMRKDSVMERLKLAKVFGLKKPGYDSHNKLKHVNRLSSARHVVTAEGTSPAKETPSLCEPLPAKSSPVTSLEGDPKPESTNGTNGRSGEGGESPANGNGNGQGEDSGIESMDALSEKSPNQGESPCRKEELHHGGEEKKGQNHDRTKDDEAKECLTEETEAPIASQAAPVPFETIDREEPVERVEQSPELQQKPLEPEPASNQSVVEPASGPDTTATGLAETVVESFETKIREAFLVGEGLGAKMMEMEGGAPAKELEPAVDKSCELGSPSLEDIERFRVKPPLYTYAKREDSLSPSPPTVEGTDQRNHVDTEQDNEECCSHANAASEPSPAPAAAASTPGSNHYSGNSRKRGKSNGDEANATVLSARNKSLLEQLLIEIPGEETRRTRSWHRLGNSPGGTPKSSPRSVKDEATNSPTPRNTPRPSPNPAPHRGKRKPTEETDAARPNKRKCSENAAELIKACMGVDEKKQEVGKVGSKGAPGATTVVSQGKKGIAETESSDDEPLIDLAGKAVRDHSGEDIKNKCKQPAAVAAEEMRNNNKPTSVKVEETKLPVDQTATRRSARQSQSKSSRRSTRNTIQEAGGEAARRRRTSRDTK